MSVCSVFCAVILALAAVNRVDAAMTLEQMEKTAQGLRNSCTSKVQADPALVAGIRRGEFPDNRALKCYTHCIMKTVRTFKNGRLDEGMMIKQVEIMMPAERIPRLKEITVKCAAEPFAGDDCETTYQFVKCNYEMDPSVFFFP